MKNYHVYDSDKHAKPVCLVEETALPSAHEVDLVAKWIVEKLNEQG